MIRNILQLIANELNSCILAENQELAEDPVVLGNIGLSTALGGGEAYMQDKIVLSLVNLMEEITLKNTSAYRGTSMLPQVENPPTFLNLFLLFSANFTSPQGGGNSSQTPYDNGIIFLSFVIQFFQSKRLFTVQNAPAPGLIQDPALQDIRIFMDLYPLTFEQMNHMWGSLGGKQLPFALYKARVLPLRKENILDRGAPVQEVLMTGGTLINEAG